MIKTVEWLDRLEELELDLSKGEVYSPAFGNSDYGNFFFANPAYLSLLFYLKNVKFRTSKLILHRKEE